MTFERFLAQLKKKLNSELGFSFEQMEYYPKGFRTDDPAMTEQIKETNRMYTGKQETALLIDLFLLKWLKKNGVTDYHRIDIHTMYEYAQEHGFDAAFDDIRDDIADDELTEAFQEAVRQAVETAQKNGFPVCKYDSEKKKAYILYPDGRKEYAEE